MEFDFTPEEVYSSKVAFAPALAVYEKMLPLYDRIMENDAVTAIINTEIRMPQPNGKDVDLPYKVMLVMYIDLIKCYQNMGHQIDFENKDSYLLPMVTNLKFRQRMTTDIEFDTFMKIPSVIHIYKNLLLSFEAWAKKDGSSFLFTRFANAESPEICGEYVDLMIAASDYIKRATPTDIKQEYKWISDLQKLSF